MRNKKKKSRPCGAHSYLVSSRATAPFVVAGIRAPGKLRGGRGVGAAADSSRTVIDNSARAARTNWS
ncbi:hypothetical protein IF1G_07931 [Cordyceps javanica]|uniref:Uncharacterized protein n=1 Tax=Cordyceps javanica TaxID=43265 RepID=A0A545UV55_9HYPO|nr:hypothetical protein IF1G_07931 [Cordyceps javanica]